MKRFLEIHAVPDDLSCWQTPCDLAKRVASRYRLSHGDVDTEAHLLVLMRRAVTLPDERAPVVWRLSRLITRGRGRQQEAWVRLVGKDDEGDEVVVPVRLRSI